MSELQLEGQANGPQSQEASALQGRVDRLELAVATLNGELSSIREQLSAMGWTRQPAAKPMRPVPPATAPSSANMFTEEPPPVPPRASPPSPVFAAAALPLPGAGSRTESIESQLGSRVLSKVAVVLLLVGTAWFLKWAFDNHWIGPTGRVLIGLLAGASVVVWSERFRRQGLAAFSYSLKAVGTGVLYLSLWAGFQVYHLMPASVALLAMIAVTAANAALALSQESSLLAGYALLGAYLTPALLSTGGNHEVFLFNYLLVVALSVGTLLRFRRWPLLVCGALPATVVYYIAWYAAHYDRDAFNTPLLYSVLLWLVFAAVPVIALEAEGIVLGVLTPLATAAFGALTVYSVLVDSARGTWKPWAALLFAAAYLVLARVRRGSLVSAIHLSLALVFLTVTIPLKATGRGITAGWLAEAVVLLWVATLPQADRRARLALRWLGCASLVLGVGGALLGPWLGFGHGGVAFLNRDFATSMGALAALALGAWLSARAGASADARDVGRVIATAAFVLGNLVLLVAMGREIHRLYLQAPGASWVSAAEHADFTFSAWLLLQGIGNLLAGFARRLALLRWAGLLLLGVTLFKVVAYDMRSLGTGYHVASYLGLGVVLMAVSFAYQKDWLHLREAVAVSDDVPPTHGAEEVRS